MHYPINFTVMSFFSIPSFQKKGVFFELKTIATSLKLLQKLDNGDLILCHHANSLVQTKIREIIIYALPLLDTFPYNPFPFLKTSQIHSLLKKKRDLQI